MKQLPPQPPPKMGDFYDPEHPTPEEEENEAKIENVQKTGFIKGPMFKGVASSRFLPKGTKTKVNLEEQGRQKVSFSFSLTKKTLQNRFLTALGSEKQNDTQNSPTVPLQVDLTPKIKMDIGDTLSTTEESSPPKSRVELGKIHFKKHLLHVTSRPLLTTTTALASPPPPIVPLPAVIAESTTVDSPPLSPPPPPPPPQATTSSPPAAITEPVALPHTPVTVLMTAPVDVAVRALKEPPVTIVPESSEVDTKQDTVSNSSEEHITQNLNEQADIPSRKDSHIGKGEEIPDSSKSSLGSKKTDSKKKSSQSEGTFFGSESDEDSVRTSSSQRSHDLKFSASIEKERDSKKSLAPLKSEDLGKSSRSKTERDDKYFSYSKLERDTRYISSRCRSERERRRSRSRSRSDRGSRTSLSYSRSERSHYYDSDRRYHRSSPYRERARYSRPYTDTRARESSDSEDEYKKTYSRRTSSHSSSYRDPRTSSSYSKSDRDCKTESSYLEMEKRGKYSSKLERESKRTSENEAMKRCCSPSNELGFRRGSSYSKHDNSVSRYKSAPSKSVPKSDKFKNSFCCTELNEEIKQSHSFSLQTPCSKGSELRMISKIPERQKTGSPSPSNRLNDSPTFKKLNESPIFKSEFIGHDSHDSNKELDSLSKVKNDQLRSYCPIESNINGSPGTESDLATFCTSKTDTVFMSSDDSVTGSEVSSLVKACMLSSNGFQNINRCKEKDLDDTCMQHSKSESPFTETEPPVSPHQDKLMSLPVMTIDYSKTVAKEPVDMRVSCCKTKDSDIYCTSNDSNPSLCYSEAENIEPSVTKISSNSFMNVHLKSKPVICDNRNLTDQHAKFAYEEYKQSVGSASSASVNHFDDLYQPIESSGIASSLLSLPPGIKMDNLTLLQRGENTSPLLDAVPKNKSTEFLKHAEKETIVEVGSGLPDSGRGFASWENRHNNGLSGKCVQEAQEEGNSILPDRRRGPEVSLDEEGGRGHAHTSDDSEVVFSSCDLNLTMEDSDSVTYTLKCDSSGHASEIVSTVHEDYSGSSESSSDESDSEDTDSDDSSIPRNRLQSVVVVPKNSTLPMEETSPCSSRSSQSYRHYSDHWEDERLESRRHSYEEKFESIARKACSQTEKFFLHKGIEKNPEISFTQPSRKQIDNHLPEIAHPQSDGVDSTSHTDVKSDPLGHPNSEETMKAKIATRQQEELPVYSSDDFEDVPNKSRQQTIFPNRTDSRLGKTELSFSSCCEISRVDGFHSSEELRNLGWDFSQQEKPTTTYQQPDSSYGACGGHKYQQSAEQYGGTRNYWQGNGYWDPRLAGRPPGTGVVYDRIQGQVPDSLTDDREEEENWDQCGGSHFLSQSSKFFLSLQKDKGSVQAPEISSNSIKDSLAVNEKKDLSKNLEKSDMKDRGPPKKRRQELESDSESDSELQDRKKVRVEVEQRETAVPPGSALVGPSCVMEDFRDPQRWKECAKQGKMPCYFDLIEENVYLTERKKNKSHRDIKRMQCECTPLSKEERAQGEIACGEDCLNRLLMIECSSRCPNGDYCSNRRFQRKQHADVEVILTEKKGWGLRAAKDLPSNTFVLEYCGEVLDHKEFKARVKEYARNKNIHYYFMALKNDEIIDATQKGNCSRFMNHSCEPNCETQKWTVNGQLRVGFFTTKLVPSGSELTFDYQFQRYGKEAQKCFCGSANCRGYLGGENRVSIRAAGGKMKKERSRKKDSVDGELEALMENGEGLFDKNQVLSLSRLMVRIETLEQKLTCLKLIQNTHSQSCLKSFLERHGLSLLWIWMAELGDGRESNQKLQEEIIKTLEHLPIPTKNMLEESKVLPVIQRWSQTKTAVPQLSEGDGYSSENTSRAQTPLNTPDPSTKLTTEADTDTPKKLMFRRLKIISENSMDSAISDATSELEGKDGKEDLDQLENVPVEEEEELQSQQLLTQQLPESKVDSEIAMETSKLPTSEPEADTEIEPKESSGTKLEEPIAEEIPSQDEEEGVSDVESERSQEQPDKTVDISDLATKLLDSWKDLKEVYRIPKKSQAEKENTITERGRDTVGFRDQTAAPKTPNRSRERDPDKQTQNKEKRKRRGSLSPPSSAYERGTKRPDDRYDTPTSKKKVRIKDRNKLSTEERRKLFEQEVAQREAQKQQQQMQNLGMTSPLPYDSLGYNASHHPFAGYPPGYPMQAYVDPSNPNAGKVLLPTPSMDPVCSPAPYDHSQPLVGHSTEPLAAPPPVPVVPHVAAPVEVSSSQYVAQSDGVVHQDSSVAVLPVPAPGPVQGQNYGVWDSNQQSVTVQQQYSPAQSQATIYYQGQTCPTVYGVTSPYSQTAPPIVQSYAQPNLQYIQGQQIFTAHPQGVVVQPTAAVTTIVAPGQPQPLQTPEMVVTNNLLDLPPPSPPKPKTIVLPPNWKTARDPEGKIYYYHVITRQTQWDPPTWESPGDDASLEHEAEMDLGTPTYDENPMKTSKKPKTAEADTSSELAKKSKEVFRKEMSQFIVQCLNPYRKPDCKVGRITTTEDFKHLARKLTHGVMNKELKYCKNPEDLECNENVKHKTKEYIKKYMQKFGAVYKPKEDTELE
ncbi:histone-lysine N-methyltransferase SETD2 isoform X1 [Diceros bicornis minor]|uniref:histone-lysine N-methyltransferase SETD2 isoform X1 n=2 Tax=Diceros bicornis minor TaxID=77932 RepID=UPI0026F07ECF|nr:histone-lysine N-methyltransferase SETD2 isoform X1 [Diceros bicornis minor]XP_058413013.1 histone-lysine N-methyltransferase SETD2 isoform X1 [Diceros bicornis minor]